MTFHLWPCIGVFLGTFIGTMIGMEIVARRSRKHRKNQVEMKREGLSRRCANTDRAMTGEEEE